MMNGGQVDIAGAALMLGHLRETMISAGVVVLLLCAAWAVEEWGVRKAAGWGGMVCLGAASVFACLMIAAGLI